MVRAAGHVGGKRVTLEVERAAGDVNASAIDQRGAVEPDIVERVGLDGAGRVVDRAYAADARAGDAEEARAVVERVDVGADVERCAVGDGDCAGVPVVAPSEALLVIFSVAPAGIETGPEKVLEPLSVTVLAPRARRRRCR